MSGSANSTRSASATWCAPSGIEATGGATTCPGTGLIWQRQTGEAAESRTLGARMSHPRIGIWAQQDGAAHRGEWSTEAAEAEAN